ncbi:MAG: NAD(P)/FAD-dependent oxidoreductase [Rubrobacteraceae bacterium]
MRGSHLLFAGGGHAHVHSLKRTAELVSSGHEVTLINPSPHLHYSGMATGVISGCYAPREHRIDVRRLVGSGGGRFVEGVVERVLPKERTLLLEDGRDVSYDAVSFCLGSETKGVGLGTPSLPVKPVENLETLRKRIKERGPLKLLVVGGGAAGCEVAANAATLMPDGEITLVESGPDLLGFAPERARRVLADHLRKTGVEVVLNRTVKSIENGSVILDDGEIPADLTIAATGVSPSKVFSRSGLATGEDGGLWVDHYLRSISDERVFGGGDAVSFRGESLPRFGVYAVRQGPVLFHNLRAALEDKLLKTFKPQKNFLYILNLGDGTGLAVYGPLAWRSRSAMRLKNSIDRRFVREHGSEKLKC